MHTKMEKIKEDYVRRDDFTAHMERQERSSARIEKQVDRINEKMDRIVSKA